MKSKKTDFCIFHKFIEIGKTNPKFEQEKAEKSDRFARNG